VEFIVKIVKNNDLSRAFNNAYYYKDGKNEYFEVLQGAYDIYRPYFQGNPDMLVCGRLTVGKGPFGRSKKPTDDVILKEVMWRDGRMSIDDYSGTLFLQDRNVMMVVTNRTPKRPSPPYNTWRQFNIDDIEQKSSGVSRMTGLMVIMTYQHNIGAGPVFAQRVQDNEPMNKDPITFADFAKSYPYEAKLMQRGIVAIPEGYRGRHPC
jgi:hypothetical protein